MTLTANILTDKKNTFCGAIKHLNLVKFFMNESNSTSEKFKPIVFGKESLVCREGKAGKAPPKVPREID